MFVSKILVFLRFWGVLEVLGSSGRPVGTISTNFRQIPSGGFRAISFPPLIGLSPSLVMSIDNYRPEIWTVLALGPQHQDKFAKMTGRRTMFGPSIPAQKKGFRAMTPKPKILTTKKATTIYM